MEDMRVQVEATMAKSRPMDIMDLQLLARKSPQVLRMLTGITKAKEPLKMEEKKEKLSQINLKVQQQSQ